MVSAVGQHPPVRSVLIKRDLREKLDPKFIRSLRRVQKSMEEQLLEWGMGRGGFQQVAQKFRGDILTSKTSRSAEDAHGPSSALTTRKSPKDLNS